MDPARFPDHRVVLEFVFTSPDPMTIWLVLEHGEVSVCHQHPGFDTDVHAARAPPRPTATFQRTALRGRRRCGRAVDVTGPPRLVRALPGWFLWSPWAEVTRERMARV